MLCNHRIKGKWKRLFVQHWGRDLAGEKNDFVESQHKNPVSRLIFFLGTKFDFSRRRSSFPLSQMVSVRMRVHWEQCFVKLIPVFLLSSLDRRT